MSDLIRKEEVMHLLTNLQLEGNDLHDAKRFVAVMPTIEAEPVVRCSECKNLEMINNEGVFAKCNKHNMLFLLWEDDIRENGCSWGEEREDGKIG